MASERKQSLLERLKWFPASLFKGQGHSDLVTATPFGHDDVYLTPITGDASEDTTYAIVKNPCAIRSFRLSSLPK
ncbi:hypothetical protein B5E41_24035 [Rhizobium esperanzae]|uniref:Uncharacterized protein n=1 Tax=Rhizobium esperanzae TaxID=1967781 RepID=A0A246DP64_9HYPH|nr:hypothetical protein B5E41_24035 [Rhizobium esperanzae]